MSGGRGTGGTRSSGTLGRRRLVRQGHLGEVAAPLRGRVHDGVVDRVERALSERRERSHLLDLVAEELDAERLAARAREHVDDAAAHGELPAILDAIDTLVAGEGERLGEPVDTRLVAGPDRDGSRPRCDRRHPLGEGRRGRAHEPAAREHVERPVALAHEVWWRLEPGFVAHAPAGKKRDTLFAEQPARRLGRVSRVGVLGQQHEERTTGVLVQSGQEQRQHRLRDAGARRQSVREGAEALGALKLGDEGCERGRVHAFGGDHAPRGHRSDAPQPASNAGRRAAIWAATRPFEPAVQPPPGAPRVP